MCRPNYYGIYYSINPWMNTTKPASQPVSMEQWDNLKDRLIEHGAAIEYVGGREGYPDMVFTANAGLVLKNKKTVIISNFLHQQRKGEEEWFVKWFAEAGYQFLYPSLPFEGAGDALYLGDTLICGYGFRSSSGVYDEIAVIEPSMLKVKLVDPRFYHLDTCFCPLQDTDYLIFPGAIEGSEAIQGNGIEVPESEAIKFACNAVCLDRKVILPAGCPETVAKLEAAGYTTVSVEMSEFLKSGGACKCLTLELS